MKYVTKFIPVENGTAVEFGETGIPGVSGIHKLVGFKPGPGPRASGWLVVLVREDATAKGMPRRLMQQGASG